MVATSLAAGFWFSEVHSITVNVEDHVAGMVPEGGIRVRGAVVEELDHLLCGF